MLAYLVRIISLELNKKKVPFRFKILSNPQMYPRADAPVLYLNKLQRHRSVGPILDMYRKVKPYLNSPTPLFAKRIAPGISLAEDPCNGESLVKTDLESYLKLYFLPYIEKDITL